MLNFKFNNAKTTEAAALLLKKNGGSMNYMKLIKLLYLIDRETLTRWGRPVTGDYYVSMKHGPVLSNVLDLINCGDDPSHESIWHKYITSPSDYSISLKKGEIPQLSELSKRERKVIDEIFEKYENADQWKMVDICHDLLPEWEDPGGSSTLIRVEAILKAVKKTDAEIREIESEVDHLNFVDKVLARGADKLLKDYAEDAELTIFTSLDGEAFDE